MSNLSWNPLVSIIIVNWNRCEDVIETLKNVENFSYKNIEIIVVDNGSTDKSLTTLRSGFPNIRLLALPSNIGCEDGNNVGILNANGEIIVFLDSDAGLEKEGITKLIDSFSQDKNVGIVEPRIIRPSDDKIINEPSNWPIRNAFTGCVVAFRAEVFQKTGLRPGEFFIYASEPDICLKAIDHGFKIIHRSDIIGEHRESPTARINKRFYFFSTRNLIWLIWRHYPLSSAVYETIFLLVIHFFRSIRHFAFHFYLQGIIAGVYGIKKQIVGKRSPLKRFDEARIFPGPKDLIKIINKKINNIRGE
tara:strand:- start:16257 stop:17171 length:915 start_codon:yes stop_codon:yes gene_type:complete